MAEQKCRKVPEIRFKGYELEWVENKLGELMTVGSVKRIHQSDWTKNGVRFLRARDIVSAYKNEDPTDILYISKSKYDEYSALSGKVDLGDLLVTGVGTIGIPYLIKDSNPLYFKDGNIIWFKNHGTLNGNFLYYSFTCDRIQNYIKESAGIGTVGTYTIGSGKNTPINTPCVDEQRIVGEYFRLVDHLIRLHQRKHEKLVVLKKAMLQKMFPQPGAAIPEIRFKGFSGAWEMREFKQVATRASLTGSDENLPRIQYDDIVSGAGLLNKDITKKTSKKIGLMFEKGDVLFGKLRPYLKNWLLADSSGIAVGDFWILRPAEATSGFIYALIQTEAFGNIANQSAGSKMPRSDWKLVSSSEFMIPSDTEEQQKIGTFFLSLDKQINQHDIQLQKLKQVKSACLKKMFV